MTAPYAVRWARRRVRGEFEWSRWHYTEDGNTTSCFRIVPPITEIAELPETNDPERVDCAHCLRRMTALEAEAVQ